MRPSRICCPLCLTCMARFSHLVCYSPPTKHLCRRVSGVFQGEREVERCASRSKTLVIEPRVQQRRPWYHFRPGSIYKKRRDGDGNDSGYSDWTGQLLLSIWQPAPNSDCGPLCPAACMIRTWRQEREEGRIREGG